VKVNIHVRDIFLKIDTSIPLGLIVNELVSNSLRHSFAESRIGEIDINIERISDKRLLLTLIDNGKEFQQGLDINKAKSFGYVLVNNLVSQINGKIEIGKTPEGKNKILIEFEEV
jgi:two-component sensor histidine kinase